ncbi:MAG: hypothetical protein HYW07_04545 [Candidatus Latescibacteria bacterium]|nr:hypothetical protein [Candidatus Latescibacterota bacterium]
MGAFFDGTGINVCDYVACKGIRRSGTLAGLFWTYTQPTLHRHVCQRIALDMYKGLLQADELHPRGEKNWRQVETFIHLQENMLVFHLTQGIGQQPKMVGLSIRSRGGYPAKKGNVSRRETDGIVVLDFPITGDIEADPRLNLGQSGQAAAHIQPLELTASLAVGIDGDGRLIQADDGNIEVAIPRSGVATIYITFDASTERRPQAEAMVRQALQKGYGAVLSDHTSAWEAFWSNSFLDLPHRELAGVYVAALYYLRSCAGKYSIPNALLAMGEHPWSVGYGGWDDTHIHHGLLTANQVSLAEAIVDHWASFKPLGEEAMQKRGGTGILLDGTGFEPEYYVAAPQPLPRDDFNGTLGAGLSAWRQYTHTGDRQYLERYYGFIKGIAEMLATYAFVPHGDRLWLKKARQIDDRFGDEGKENAFGPAVMGKALLANAAAACEEMGDKETARRYLEASEGIELPMSEGVYISFPDCPLEALSDESILNFFPAMIIPDSKAAKRTLDYYEQTCMSTYGLVNNRTYSFAVFPWVHFKAMIGEVMLGRREKFEQLLGQVLTHRCYASDFRLLPEWINRRDGWHNLPGYLTTAGAFLQMVNLMLLYGDGQSLWIFPAVPEGWLENRIAFRLRSPPGVLVDVCAVPGRGVEAQVESAKPVTVYVRKPRFAGRALMGGNEMKEEDGYVRFEAPIGLSRTRINWRIA